MLGTNWTKLCIYIHRVGSQQLNISQPRPEIFTLWPKSLLTITQGKEKHLREEKTKNRNYKRKEGITRHICTSKFAIQVFYQAEYPLLKTVFPLIWSCSGAWASIQLSQHHPLICGGREPFGFILTAWDNLSSKVSMTWPALGSRKPVLVYLLPNSFVKSKRPSKCPPRHYSLCCSLCKSDLSRKRNCIKHSILLSGKINTLFNSLLLNLTSGTMKPCSVLSTKVTGANHLTVITHWYPGKSWGELRAVAVLVFAAAELCREHVCCLHHASHSSHSSLPWSSSYQSSTEPHRQLQASNSLSNSKVFTGNKTENLQ